MNTSAMHYLPRIDGALIDELLAGWQAAHPQMGILALLPEAEKGAVALIQQVCARRNLPVVGAIFPALITDAHFSSEGVWLLRFDHMPYTALHPELPHDSESTASVAESIVAGIRPHIGNDGREITLFMLFDSMVPNIGSLLDEIYLLLANRVHYMGANAGSETFQPMPCLFDSTQIVQNGVLVMLLEPHRGAILDHGYGVPPQMITATSTEGNRILQIDWRSAFEVYQEIAREQYGVDVNRENFYQYAVHFPFGIVRANGVILVRIPVALEEDGSLFCVGEVPPNSVLTLLEAPTVDSAGTLETLVQGLTELNGPLDVRDVMLFYCAGRRLHLGIDKASDEIKGLAEHGKPGQLGGALSLGEIGSTTQWGYPLFHNATLVASVWNGE